MTTVFTEKNIIKKANSGNPREHALARLRNEEYIAGLEGRLLKSEAENTQLRVAIIQISANVDNIYHAVQERFNPQALNGDENER